MKLCEYDGHFYAETKQGALEYYGTEDDVLAECENKGKVLGLVIDHREINGIVAHVFAGFTGSNRAFNLDTPLF